MKPSEKIVVSVETADVEAANIIAAELDYEPNSTGAFFDGYGDPVTHFITEIDVRPWTREAIETLIASGQVPASFKLHTETNIEDVVALLTGG